MSEDEIIGLWDIFKSYIAEKNKEAAAVRYVNYLLDEIGIPRSELDGLSGYDPHLDEALEQI